MKLFPTRSPVAMNTHPMSVVSGRQGVNWGMVALLGLGAASWAAALEIVVRILT